MAGELVLQQLGLRSALRKSGHRPAGPHGYVRGASRVGLLPKEKYARQATTRSRTRAESVEECGLRQCEKSMSFLPSIIVSAL